MPQTGHEGLPDNWAQIDGEFYCLGCRRMLAGEAAVDVNDEASSTREERLQLRKTATLEFEINRDPDRPDRVIARACRTSVPAVVKVRRRLA